MTDQAIAATIAAVVYTGMIYQAPCQCGGMLIEGESYWVFHWSEVFPVMWEMRPLRCLSCGDEFDQAIADYTGGKHERND